ncbi:hypothetical protein [Amycolatopsis sp. cmx-4-68]|uniref:hypothetical protein n=1 Tax=Amycolatopsis sp. cmx-4-68 TaxID=2790938 RepID=UPI0039794D8A
MPRTDEHGANMGTLSRLATLLTTRDVPEDAVRRALKPLREVRQARQKPAHSLRKNITDQTFVHKQIDLLRQVGNSLQSLREFWQSHPDNEDWQPEHEPPEKLYRM